MKRSNKECPVTGKEVVDPLEAPQSSINGTALAFCTSTCKSIFDRYLVKFAEILYPAKK